MVVLMWDGRRLECRKVEISMNRQFVILDGCDVYPICDVSAIVAKGAKK